MGVPGLSSFVNKRFKKYCKKIKIQNRDLTKRPTDAIPLVHNLYIDANGLLHQAAQKIFNYGQYNLMMDPCQNLTYLQKKMLTYNLFLKYTRDIIYTVNPKELIYIAIDGPAPRAKQVQQRRRRFVTARERSPSQKFDSNCITPGTGFIDGLTNFLRSRFLQEKKINGATIVFSSASVAGEGEHKIMDFLRKHSKFFKNKSHLVFGPDGDLILLTLGATHFKRMYLLRSNHFKPVHFGTIYNISQISLHMQKLCKAENRIHRISDFILMSFFIGNDFLPMIRMFYTLRDGFNIMFKFNASHFIDCRGRLNLNNLCDLVTNLAKVEEAQIHHQAFIKPKKEHFTNQTLLKHCSGEGVFHFSEYRKDYYLKNKIYIEKNGELKINQLCFDYLKTFVWNFIYYTRGLPSWTWYFKWNYAPLMVDFKKFLDKINIFPKQASSEKTYMDPKIFQFKKNNPPKPFLQLMSVLPAKSANLLPKPFAKYMTETTSPLVKKNYYPKEFEIDYEGKTKNHEGVPILKFLNFRDVELIHNQIKYPHKRNKVEY